MEAHILPAGEVIKCKGERTNCSCDHMPMEQNKELYHTSNMDISCGSCQAKRPRPSHVFCPKGNHWWHKGRWTASNNHEFSVHSSLTFTYLTILFLAAGLAGARGEIKYSIPEEDQPGILVGNVFEDSDLNSRYEGDTTILNQLRFRFLRGEQDNFAINERTGVITTTRSIDREAIPDCGNRDNCEIKLDVAVQPVQYFQIIKVTVDIIDTNDHFPVFSEKRITHTMLESTLPGNNIFTLNVGDLDSPLYSIQRLELLPASGTPFRVTSSTQIDGSLEVRLKLQEALDRETQSEYNLRIVAYDGGTPVKTSSTDIQIIVEDANDNNPIFESPYYDVTIPEDLNVPHVIVQVNAADPDSGSNGEVTYGFTTSTIRSHGDQFSINPTTGEITLTKQVDYEGLKVYHLGVTATDRGHGAIPAEATVAITVNDVNDHPPAISVSTLNDDGSGKATVPEKSPTGTFVAHISVSDEDSGPNAQVSCFLDSSDFSLNFMYDNEYQMVAVSEFDREMLSEYRVVVSCMDQGADPLTSETTIDVLVSDINDHPPVFDQRIYDAELIEHSFEGAIATRVHATDLDDGINAEIVYSLPNDIQHVFMVDPYTGDIKARVGIDRERVERFQFIVYATDKGTPHYSASATVNVNIQDINDEKPVFTQPSYSFGVFENEQPGAEVGIISAEDADGFPFNLFRFKFSERTDAFVLHPETGRITTRKVLDRETQSVYHLIAKAVDDGVPPQSSTVSVSIYIADKNDNGPIFLFPNGVNSSVFVAKDAPYGYIVTRVDAYDLDIGNNAKLTYEIVSGNEEQLFDIDHDRGTVLVTKSLYDYEDTTFMFNISVKDSGVPAIVAYTVLMINVNSSTVAPPPAGEHNDMLGGNNLVIVIALASTSGVITIILVIAIICIRRQDRSRNTSNGRYNCRMEALKFLNIGKRKTLVNGSTSSGSTTNGSDSGDSTHKNKKEVSFSLEVEENPIELTESKSGKSWPSMIDHQILQTPRAHSSLLTDGLPSPPLHNGSTALHSNQLDYLSNSHQYGTHRPPVHPPPPQYNGNGQLRNYPSTHREIEIQQLLEMLKRDQDSSSLTSGEGSNTDSGRGASEEGDHLQYGPRATDIPSHSGVAGQLPTVPEDSYSSNQVVPSCCDSSVSFLSTHNSTLGSYVPPDYQRAPSRSSRTSSHLRYPVTFKTFQNSPSTDGSAKTDSTILDMTTVSQIENITQNSQKTKSPKLKSILKQTSVSGLEIETPLAQTGMDNYLKNRQDAVGRRLSETSELESDVDESAIKYSCVDMSDILQSRINDIDASALKYSCVNMSDILHSKVSRSPDADDDDATSTSGSYVIDPKELCDEIDELFFKGMA